MSITLFKSIRLNILSIVITLTNATTNAFLATTGCEVEEVED